MKAFIINEKKKFMSMLLISEVFDNFALSELQLQGAFRLQIDGKRNASFYTTEEMENLPEPEYLLWTEIKPLIYQSIKGSKTPISFRIVFRLSGTNTKKVLEHLDISMNPEEVGGLFLNLQYEQEQLKIVSGAAMKTFSTDRTLEQAWDVYAERFLKKNGIEYE